MTFDQWVDAVDSELHGRLGGVKTAELSWESATWTYGRDAAFASVDENEQSATVAFDNGDKLSFGLSEPKTASEAIAGHLSSR